MNFPGGAIRRGIHVGQAREFPGELVEPSHAACTFIRRAGLVPDASGQGRCHDRDDQEDDERKQLMRLRDLKGMERLNKEEIVRQER
jgi:hypothetical protein